MAFVYEKVREEDKELFYSIGWKKWDLEPVTRTFEWCIDKENKIYMRGAGGGMHDLPYYYDMCYGNRIIRIEMGGARSEGDRQEGIVIHKYVDNIYIPKSIWEKRHEIIQAIRDALASWDYNLPKEKLKSVNVNILKEPIMVEFDYNGR